MQPKIKPHAPDSPLDQDASCPENSDDGHLGGYRVNLTKDQLDKAPKYSSGTDWRWNRENDQRVYDYYKTPPYWGM
jgi:hypothetical protein